MRSDFQGANFVWGHFAHDLLVPLCRWFTQGFDTADLTTPKRCWTSSVDLPTPGYRRNSGAATADDGNASL